nr:hypothetical protein [Hankyongella ginsenosidimutans]
MALAAGAAAQFRRSRADPIVVAATAMTLALLLQPVFTVEGRYRKPLEPFVILGLVRLAGTRPRTRDPQNDDLPASDSSLSSAQPLASQRARISDSAIGSVASTWKLCVF